MALPTEHPDDAQLAAFEAGDLDARAAAAVERHQQTCGQCVAMIEHLREVRVALAGLPEPDLPVGLHERLVAAGEHAGANGAPGTARPSTSSERAGGNGEVAAAAALGARREAHTPSPAAAGGVSRRRALAWLAVAAALLVGVLGVRSLVSGTPGPTTSSFSASAASAPPSVERLAAPASGSGLPAFGYTGNYSVGVLSRSAAASAVHRALAAALAGPSFGSKASTGTADQGVVPSAHGTATATAGSNAAAPSAAVADLCLRSAARTLGTPLRPAFFVQTSWHGRPATVLIAVTGRQATGGAVVVFPRNSCQHGPVAVVHTTLAGLGLRH